MAPKKNAYTFYVEERCKKSGRSIIEGYGAFGQDWEKLDASEKRKYVQLADQLQSQTLSADQLQNQTLSADQLQSQLQSQTLSADQLQNQDRAFGQSQTLSKDKGSSSVSAVESRKMADIIMEVSHGVAEIVIDEASTADISAPECEQLEEEIVRVIEEEYKDVNDILMNEVFVGSCVPLVYKDRNLKEVNRPVEIAVENFKLGVGFTGSVFHEFIHPGAIPAGWQYWISTSRKEYHKIPAGKDVNVDAESKSFHHSFKLNTDYYEIYATLVRVLQKPGGGMSPLLIAAADVCVAAACLQWLHNKATAEGRESHWPDLPEISLSTVEEYCVNILLKKGLASSEELKTLKNTLGAKRYHHEPALRCDYHQEVDSEVCARGTARDKIFLTFDYLRGILGLPDEGAYVPNGVKR